MKYNTQKSVLKYAKHTIFYCLAKVLCKFKSEILRRQVSINELLRIEVDNLTVRSFRCRVQFQQRTIPRASLA